MGGIQMIDLISDGLALRKKLTLISEARPQSIRNNSASENQHATKGSATSAESASASKKTINQNYYADLKDIGVAEVADVAEYQPGPAYVTADASRISCGIEKVVCDDCKYFTIDSIGDGAGIGDCALGVTWTQEYNGRRPLYRYAKRYCSKFINLMD